MRTTTSYRPGRSPFTRDSASGGVRRFLVLAVVAFVLTFALGALVSNRLPSALDLSELGQFGVATPVAEFLTTAGRFPTYLVLALVALAFGFLNRDWLARCAVSVVLLVAVWQSSDLVKVIFHRARPLHPIVAETSFGFPSGHADQAVAFYGFWAYWIWKSDLPRELRAGIVSFLALWTLAIGWSRLALGAHFPSDVFGGYAFGIGWLALAIVASLVIERRAARERSVGEMGVRISRR